MKLYTDCADCAGTGAKVLPETDPETLEPMGHCDACRGRGVVSVDVKALRERIAQAIDDAEIDIGPSYVTSEQYADAVIRAIA